MRISDILKGKNGSFPGEGKPPPPAKRQKEEKKKEPGSLQPGKPEPQEESVSYAGKEIYKEAFLVMENFWMKLETEKPYDLKLLRDLATRLVKGFLEDPCLLIELNQAYAPENYLPYHSANVCLISIAIGARLKYTEEALSNLALAALLHDIGMAKVPRSIWLKKEKLPPEELEEIKKHPIHNIKILERIEGITEKIISGVSQSHERENGGGYPSGIKNGQIHKYGKIIGLADTYEALTHDRVYKKAISPYHAIKEIIRKDGQFFDHTLLKTLIETVTFYPMGCCVELNTGEIGVVKCVSPEFPTRPTIKIVLDEKKKKSRDEKLINLSAQPFVSIRKILKKEKVEKCLKDEWGESIDWKSIFMGWRKSEGIS